MDREVSVILWTCFSRTSGGPQLVGTRSRNEFGQYVCAFIPLLRKTRDELPCISPSTDLLNDDFTYKRKLKIKLPTPDGVVSER